MKKEKIGINDDYEDTIDLLAFFKKVKYLWYVVVTGVLIGALIAVIYSALLKTPYYESSSMVYIRSSKSTISLQDLQVSATLTSDYEIIFKTRPNLEKVIENLDLDYTYDQLYSMISISNPTDTRILKVSVQTDNPRLSKDIVNEVVDYGMDSIREIDSQEPYLLEKAIANPNKVGASTLKTCAMGALVGLVISMGGIFVYFALSDRISSIEDVENALGVPVLSVVPEDKVLSYTKKKVRKGSRLIR